MCEYHFQLRLKDQILQFVPEKFNTEKTYLFALNFCEQTEKMSDEVNSRDFTKNLPAVWVYYLENFIQ